MVAVDLGRVVCHEVSEVAHYSLTSVSDSDSLISSPCAQLSPFSPPPLWWPGDAHISRTNSSRLQSLALRSTSVSVSTACLPPRPGDSRRRIPRTMRRWMLWTLLLWRQTLCHSCILLRRNGKYSHTHSINHSLTAAISSFTS